MYGFHVRIHLASDRVNSGLLCIKVFQNGMPSGWIGVALLDPVGHLI